MKTLALILALTAVHCFTPSAFGQFTQSQLIDEWQRSKAYTKEYLDAMPEEGYAFKPTTEMRSFAQQMLHLADVNFFFAVLATGKTSPYGQSSADHSQLEKMPSQTKEATTKAVMESYDFAISALQGMSAASALEVMNFAKRDISKLGLFGKGFEHQAHHRGQTTVYLRLKGVVPPREKLF